MKAVKICGLFGNPQSPCYDHYSESCSFCISFSNCFLKRKASHWNSDGLVKWLINHCLTVVYWRPPKPLDWPLVDDGRRTYCTIYQPSSARLAVVNDSWCTIGAILRLFNINYFSNFFCKSLQHWSKKDSGLHSDEKYSLGYFTNPDICHNILKPSIFNIFNNNSKLDKNFSVFPSCGMSAVVIVNHPWQGRGVSSDEREAGRPTGPSPFPVFTARHFSGCDVMLCCTMMYFLHCVE